MIKYLASLNSTFYKCFILLVSAPILHISDISYDLSLWPWVPIPGTITCPKHMVFPWVETTPCPVATKYAMFIHWYRA